MNRIGTPAPDLSDGHDFWSTEKITYRQIETSRGVVEYADVGQGLPILYFHGTGAGADSAIILERSLLDDGFRLIVPNRPGYYGTSLSCGRSPNDCADLAAELLDRLNIDRVGVIGTSGGGLAAPCFASRHPARTVALVLQCALCHPFVSGRWMPPRIRWLFPLFKYWRIFLPILRVGFRGEMRKLRSNPNAIVSYLSGPREAELHDDEATRAVVPLLVASELRCAEHPAGIENDWANDVGEPWLTCGSVKRPTLIFHDRADPLVPFRHVEWALRCIPGAKHCDLHAGGHMIWVGKDAKRMCQERGDFFRCHFDATNAA